VEKLRIGIIGNGSISHLHANAYKKLPNVELVAACDINSERGKSFAAKYGITRTFSDAKQMLSEVELDGVSVCTWNNTHASNAIAALNAGINVLCEKPLALNAELGKEMIEAAQRNGKLLMTGFVRRFGVETGALRDKIANGSLGSVYYAKTGYLRRVGNPGGWFANSELSGGGPLIDLGGHIIDLARFLMGNPQAVSVQGSTFSHIGARENIQGIDIYKSADYDKANPFNDVEDMAVGYIKFDNGATLVVETSWSQHIKKDKFYVELYGDKGGVSLVPELEIFSEKDNFLTDEKVVIDNSLKDIQGIFDSEIAHFVDCLANGTPCCSPAVDGLEVMRIIDAIYESAKTGHEVIIRR